MKKILFITVLLCLFASTSYARDFYLFFVDQEETIGSGEDAYQAFVVDQGGENETIIPKSKVTVIKTVGATSMFIYKATSLAQANLAISMPEYRGMNYTDVRVRVEKGLGDGTFNELDYITGAHWYVDGEWHFGNVKDWETAGSPSKVIFGSYRKILGVEFD